VNENRDGRRRLRLAAVALLAPALVAGGCGRSEETRSARRDGSAVWVDPRAVALDAEGWRTLAAAGVEELFLEAGTLTWEGSRPGIAEAGAAWVRAVPPGAPVTLVVRGSGPGREVSSSAQLEVSGRELARALRAVRLRAEAEGVLPIGYHLDLAEEPAAELLRGLRAEAGPGLLVSASLARERLRAGRGRGLAATADFVVCFLYGQLPGVADDPEAWNPARARDDITALEALGAPYLVGVVVLGSAQRLSPSGELRESTTLAGLKDLAVEPALLLSIGDPLSGGVGRAVHSFQAQRPVRAAGWELAPGETVRVVRTAPSLVQGLLGELDRAPGTRRLGQLFYRVAAHDEKLSLGAEELAAALGAPPVAPELRPKLVVAAVRNDTFELRFELANRSRQSTDLAATDGNFVRIRAEGGHFDRVDPGEFSRYTLWRGGREVRPGLPGWREPDEVRLYTPMVRGGERIGGAVLDLRRRVAQPAVFVSGRFFLPDGRELELDAVGGPLAGPGLVSGRERQ
jgi:hypothetical protein